MQAMEKVNAQGFLEEPDLPAHGRLRDPELVGCQRETAQASDSFKFNKGGQRRYKSPISLCSLSGRFHFLVVKMACKKNGNACTAAHDDIREWPAVGEPSQRELKPTGVRCNMTACHSKGHERQWSLMAVVNGSRPQAVGAQNKAFRHAAASALLKSHLWTGKPGLTKASPESCSGTVSDIE